MKAFIFLAALAVPTLGSASLGPSIAQSEAAVADVHVMQLAWSEPGEPGVSGASDCTNPTPQTTTPVLYACVAFPDAE
jgi:hypothetical protein